MIQIIFRTALPLLPLLVDLIGGIDVAVGKNIIFAESPDNISEIILLLLAEILKIRRRAAGKLLSQLAFYHILPCGKNGGYRLLRRRCVGTVKV